MVILVFSALKDKDYYDAEGKASLADAKLAEMNQKYIDLYQNGYVPPSAITDGFSEVLTNLNQVSQPCCIIILHPLQP